MSHGVRVSWSQGLARGLWGGTGAWLGIVLCLIALICQSIHLGNLKKELHQIQRSKEEPSVEVREHQKADENSLQPCSRERRELTRGRVKQNKGKRCILHLVPQSFSSDELLDATEVFWRVSLQVGNSLDVHEASVRVKDSGIYFIYSQVLYHDTTFTMGQLVTRLTGGDPRKMEILFRCVQSMPDNQHLAYNSCYSAGVFRLQKGDLIRLTIPRYNISLDSREAATFLGFVKL